MPSNINFFTPVHFSNKSASCKEKLMEDVDHYFFLGGRRAKVIDKKTQEVEYKKHTPSCLTIALKICSYATLIMPSLMFIAKAILRANNNFHVCENRVQPAPNPQPPMPVPDPFFNNEPIVKAPFTLVRSNKPSDLKISVIYNQKFTHVDPTAPKPSEIRDSKHTWNVTANTDGTMTTEKQEKIRMIWWEAIRKEENLNVDPSQSALVKKEDLKEFLGSTLKKLGVKESELSSFITFWHETFMRTDTLKDAPYVLVEMINPEDLNKYLPEMQVEGKDADSFDLKRFYFRFEPTTQKDQGMNSDVYLKNLEQKTLGPNVVLDLGGEFAKSHTIKYIGEMPNAAQFNDAFIREHIYSS